MPDVIERFFLSLEPQGHRPLLENVQGTIRFDLRENGTTDQWVLSVNRGWLRVSRNARQPADTVFITDTDAFRRIVLGEERIFGLLLRGRVLVRGKWPLALVLSRILPSPAGAQGPRLRRRGQS
jgi:hypothetical protein